ncbi:aldehyde dehydrogenase (NADP(+)) [Nocardia sp. NBC_01377]|uniref:aldehyde dehydrogenase (NADP(+)) n=1 Tax=Nocardia sp. NBC_01377 TaxID=2903595 RepID=UPI00325198D6
MTSTPVWSVDPRTGRRRHEVAAESQTADVDRIVRAAHASTPALADRERRSLFLRTAADLLGERAAELAETADAETALGTVRLAGEIVRTRDQLRGFAEVVDAGEYLGIVIDHPDGSGAVPTPDLRRYKIPLGVVAVYAASNFPFAFSVAGGDTASALAAGCAVVVKVHPDHPATSEAVAAVLREAAVACGVPLEVVGLVHGFDAGVDLIVHPLIAASGFTGSVRGGRALHDAAAARPVPIPFHGELGSLNPVLVTEDAAKERGGEIAAGLATSMTAGHGQFCVKPGLVFVPSDDSGDRLVDEFASALADSAPGVLLDHRIRDAFVEGVRARAALPTVTEPVPLVVADRHRVGVAALQVPAHAFEAGDTHRLLLEECFGPVTVLVRYRDIEEVFTVLAALTGSLTTTVHVGDDEAAHPRALAPVLADMARRSGRLVVNGWPTGVAVKPAQHHGGPYPASTSTSTSVGTTAIERWLRPITYQNSPDSLLPAELREANPYGLPRRVDGHLV